MKEGPVAWRKPVMAVEEFIEGHGLFENLRQPVESEFPDDKSRRFLRHAQPQGPERRA